MTQEKKARLVASTTVVSVLLLFILVITLVYQMVSYSAIKKQTRILEEQKALLEREISGKEDELNNRKTEWQMELQARKYGLLFPDDTKFRPGE